ncbi:hypothetical protein FGIG_05525 [Fasciola gigantica]|uniref:Uncharacterized protein n=1 Tax=Fasciola gigantica TaxID=46835 RepID=A0A504YFF3_FASGI|nr:hypothetical protein FGIG_05525 [Fasciola gigantica]
MVQCLPLVYIPEASLAKSQGCQDHLSLLLSNLLWTSKSAEEVVATTVRTTAAFLLGKLQKPYDWSRPIRVVLSAIDAARVALLLARKLKHELMSILPDLHLEHPKQLQLAVMELHACRSKSKTYLAIRDFGVWKLRPLPLSTPLVPPKTSPCSAVQL